MRVITTTHGKVLHGRCVLCRKLYESVGSGWVLSITRGPEDYVCLQCVEYGPRRAARILRARAARVRRLAIACNPCLRAWGWTGLHRLLLEHAAALDALAGRFAERDRW